MFVVAHNGAHVWGGAERGSTLLMAGLQGRGHRVLLLCNDPLVAERASELGVRTEVLPLGGDAAVWDAVRFARALRWLAPDAFLVTTFRKLWLGALAARLGGVPRVVLRIGLETDTPRNVKYRVVMTHWVDCIVLKADDVRAQYLAALPQVPEERIVTIYGAVEPRERMGSPGAVRRELGIPPEAPVMGAVGRLARQKRLDCFIAALARLPERVHGILAGDGEERAALETQAQAQGVAHRLHFLGHREDVGDVLDALDIAVVTSDREMLSFAMLEALAAGLPVVSTPVSGAAEALDPLPDGRRPGVVTAGFEAEEIARVVSQLLHDPARLAEMGAAARQRAEERFSFERMLDGWERVLAGRGAPGEVRE
jgi:glycosyltransferase involved in cell wall biosynthesis